LLGASYSYLGKRWSGNAAVQWQSESFRQLGSQADQLAQQSGSAQLNLPLGAGTLSVNYLRHQLVGAALMRIVNLNFSQRLASNLVASMVVLKPLSSSAGTTLGLTLTLLLDAQHVASSSLSGGATAHSAYTTVSRTTPRDGGFGYRLASLNGSDPARQQASLAHNQSNGSFQAEVVRQQTDVSTRLSAQGGLALIEDDVYFGRRLDESFAVVKVAGVAKIPIYLENQVAAHTNARGRAVVGPLRAYQDNNISLDPLTLKIDTTINAVKHTVVPRSQGGVLVDFEARQVRRATLTLRQIAGTVLPPWTTVEVRGVASGFVVGQRGEVFVELPQPGANQAMARLPDGSRCQFTVDVPVGAANLSFLEPITCLPVQ
jgi:outer membrane usher protein